MKLILTLICLLAITGATLAAPGAETIAVPEFQNKSGKIVRINRWDLAAWMSNELKRTHRFQPADRKAVGRAMKDTEWNEGRLNRAGEERLKELPAHFVIYGAIGEWMIVNSVSSRDSDNRGSGSAIVGATVVLAFTLVDLSTGKSVKEFIVDGYAMGNPNDSKYPNPPYLDDDARFDDLFEDASKMALHKAARLLAPED